ncbi:hypothetical protein MKZ38_004477 [Zalerion maritima]|uniref:Ankyrin n=1 Tax=Zalerion maritima TaxID=339359 RepID=A0AAD5RLG5_9PEZI|nr:hypothetical protein MKZ38_004477 [Zalerion maritima]
MAGHLQQMRGKGIPRYGHHSAVLEGLSIWSGICDLFVKDGMRPGLAFNTRSPRFAQRLSIGELPTIVHDFFPQWSQTDFELEGLWMWKDGTRGQILEYVPTTSLIKAVEGLDIPVKYLRDPRGHTLLHISCMCGNFAAYARSCTDLRSRPRGYCPLSAVILGGYIWPADFESDEVMSFTLELNDPDVFGLLDQYHGGGKRFDFNRPNKHGQTPLCAAVLLGRQETVEWLARNPRVDPNKGDKDTDFTALHHAVRCRNESLVSIPTHRSRVLRDAKDTWGKTAFNCIPAQEREVRHAIVAEGSLTYSSILDFGSADRRPIALEVVEAQ